MKRIFTLVFAALFAFTLNAQVKIFEFYGGGGATTGSPSYQNDYVILRNLGNAPVNLSGYSIQYGSPTSGVPPAFWSTRSVLTGIIPAKGCFSIKLSIDGVFTGAVLPFTPDFSCDLTNSFNSSGTAVGGISAGGVNGKIALVNGTAMIDNTTIVVDKIGYGSANNGEGTVTAALSTTTAARRNGNGVIDTDNNTSDFTIGTPNPTSCPVLPVELTSFTAKSSNSKTNLYWQTASEKNNSHFAIERSNDGDVFSKIGEVKGNGNSTITQNYQYTDVTPTKGINYYRLRQVDFDGTESVSKTVSVNFDSKVQNKVKVYPTLVLNAVNVELSDDSKAEIAVRDLTGRVILTQNTEGVSNTTLNLGALSSGLYILTVRSNEALETVKIYKQ
jgi:Secretion system C-terminal sorting domain